MSCLKLQVGTLKQCLVKDVDAEGNHPGDCVFTLLRPEVAAAQDKRKERDNQLVRRQVAQGFIPALLNAPVPPGECARIIEGVVDGALALADDLIAKTGGQSP